jgi:hypothetical protein
MTCRVSITDLQIVRMVKITTYSSGTSRWSGAMAVYAATAATFAASFAAKGTNSAPTI